MESPFPGIHTKANEAAKTKHKDARDLLSEVDAWLGEHPTTFGSTCSTITSDNSTPVPEVAPECVGQ